MKLEMAVEKRFSGFELSLDFTVEGDRIGLFGKSGGGKSTLVHLLAGLLEPDRGEINLDGNCLYSSSRGINLPPERRRTAIVFQQHCLFPHLSVRNNLLYGFRRCPPDLRGIDFDVLAALLKIGNLLDRGITNLSGGEKQRVALGRAILASPRLLLMDEPLSALDDGLRFQIIPYLKSVSEKFGIPYLFISHSMTEMRLMTDRVLVVERGRIARQTTSDQLARTAMGQDSRGFMNLLELSAMTERDGLCVFQWSGGELILSAGHGDATGGLFELSSKDIILFKKHPEAISARNLLECRISSIFASGSRLGVELECGGGKLLAEIVPEAARELGIIEGCVVFAAIKASAFRRLSATEAPSSMD